jgi:hypothetical protein
MKEKMEGPRGGAMSIKRLLLDVLHFFFFFFRSKAASSTQNPPLLLLRQRTRSFY